MFIALCNRFAKFFTRNQDLVNEVKRLDAAVAELQQRLSESLQREHRELERKMQEQQEALQQQVESEAMSLTEVMKTHTMPARERDSQEVEIEIKKLCDKIDQISKEAQSALGSTGGYLESTLTSEIYKEQNARINPLRKKLEALKHELAQSKLAKLYRRIDMKFLQRRKWMPQLRLPVPRFASFDFNQSACDLLVSSTSGNVPETRGSDLPPGLNQFYESTITAFDNHAKTRSTTGTYLLTGIAAQLPGALPSELRAILPEVRKHFSSLFVVTEAPEWDVLVEVSDRRDYRPSIPLTPYKSQEQDALLIGEKHGTYWLVVPFRTVAISDFISQHLKAK